MQQENGLISHCPFRKLSSKIVQRNTGKCARGHSGEHPPSMVSLAAYRLVYIFLIRRRNAERYRYIHNHMLPPELQFSNHSPFANDKVLLSLIWSSSLPLQIRWGSGRNRRPSCKNSIMDYIHWIVFVFRERNGSVYRIPKGETSSAAWILLLQGCERGRNNQRSAESRQSRDQ